MDWHSYLFIEQLNCVYRLPCAVRFVAQKTSSAATFAVLDDDRQDDKVICIAVNRRVSELIVSALNLYFGTGEQLALFDRPA
jgi:hypothetical protein